MAEDHAPIAPNEAQAAQAAHGLTVAPETTPPAAAQTPVTPTSPPVRPRWGRRLILTALVLVGLGVGGWWFGPFIVLLLTTVSTDDAYVNGHVTFVAPRVRGQVVRVLVDDNYRVKKGDLLVQLDKEPYRVEVERKKAALEVAQTKLVQTKAKTRATMATARALRYKLLNTVQQIRGQIQQLQGDVAALGKYQASLEDADKEYRRVSRLVTSGAAPREELDRRTATWLEAQASVRMAREKIRQTRAALNLPLEPPDGKNLGHTPENLEQNHPVVRSALSDMVVEGAQLGLELPRGIETPDEVLKRLNLLHPDEKYEAFVHKLFEEAPAIKVAAADVDQARSDLAQAELDLRYTDVVAEIDGAVTRRNVNPGNNVQAGQSLMAVRSLTEIWIDANFKETQLADLRIGHKVRCEVDMYGSRRVYEGRITGFTMGTGQTLALLPPQNATGNFVKIVQRLPVRIELTSYDPEKEPLFVGLSVNPYVFTKEPPTGPNAGDVLQPFSPLPQGPTAPNQ
jgi:membrane fusion protein (multidrug efflux system)